MCISEQHSFLKELAILKVKRLILVWQTFKEHQLLAINNIITYVQIASFALPWLLPIAMWSSPSWQPQPTSTLGDQTPQQRLHCANIPNTIFLFDGFKNRLGFPINIYLFQQHRKQTVRKHSQGTRGHFHFDRFFFWMILMKMVAHSWFMLFTIKKQERK